MAQVGVGYFVGMFGSIYMVGRFPISVWLQCPQGVSFKARVRLTGCQGDGLPPLSLD